MIAVIAEICAVICIGVLMYVLGRLKDRAKRLRLAKEASKLARENFSLEKRCAHLTAKLSDEELEQGEVGRRGRMYLDNIAAVKQETPRCKEINLKKAYFEAYLLRKDRV